jgi:hypothetical protein
MSIKKIAEKEGLEIVDAKTSRAIEIVQKDIDQGRRQDPEHCVFANACRRKGIKEAYFFRDRAYLREGKKLVKYIIPMRIQKEIVAFDRGGTVIPNSFHLAAPSPSQRRGSVKKYNKKYSGKKKTKGKRKYSNPKRAHRTQAIRIMGSAYPS